MKLDWIGYQSIFALVQKTTQLEILANTFVSGTTATDKNVIYSAQVISCREREYKRIFIRRCSKFRRICE